MLGNWDKRIVDLWPEQAFDAAHPVPDALPYISLGNRLRSRLLIGYGAVLALAVIGLAMGLTTTLSLSGTTEQLAFRNFRSAALTSQLRSLAEAQQLVMSERLARPGFSAIGLAAALETDALPLLAEIEQAIGPPARASADAARAALRRLRAAVALAAQRGPDEVGVPAEVVAAFTELRAAASSLFYLNLDAMHQRAREIDSRARQLSLAQGVLVVFTVLIGVLASVRLAERLSRPLEQLAEAAGEIGEGRFDVRVRQSGLYETDRLARRFNAMADALARFRAINLEQILAGHWRLDRVIESIDDGLLIVDHEARVERLNSVAAAQLQVDAEQSRGCKVAELALPAEVISAIEAWARDPAALPEGVHEFTRGEGNAARLLAVSLLPFDDGMQGGLLLMLRDVTAQRRFERLRNAFVLRASHELRTPLTGMRMAFELLDQKLQFPPDSREGELMDTLRVEMARMVALLDDLLDLSRLYAQATKLKREPCRPRELLEAAAQRFAARAQSTGITLSVEPACDLPERAELEISSIERLLDNLLVNALRHTPSGGSIRLIGRRRGVELEYIVEDTGEGIPPAQLERIFEPFVQGSGRRGAAGLGLAICREIVEQHGGRIRVRSAPGRGARFEVRLPLVV